MRCAKCACFSLGTSQAEFGSLSTGGQDLPGCLYSTSPDIHQGNIIFCLFTFTFPNRFPPNLENSKEAKLAMKETLKQPEVKKIFQRRQSFIVSLCSGPSPDAVKAPKFSEANFRLLPAELEPINRRIDV